MAFKQIKFEPGKRRADPKEFEAVFIRVLKGAGIDLYPSDPPRLYKGYIYARFTSQVVRSEVYWRQEELIAAVQKDFPVEIKGIRTSLS